MAADECDDDAKEVGYVFCFAFIVVIVWPSSEACSKLGGAAGRPVCVIPVYSETGAGLIFGLDFGRALDAPFALVCGLGLGDCGTGAGFAFGLAFVFGRGFGGCRSDAGGGFRPRLDCSFVFALGFGECGLFPGLILFFLLPLYTPFFVRIVPEAGRGEE